MAVQKLLAWCVTALLASLLAGCASNDTCYEPTTPPESLRSIYIVKRAWHTGVAVAAADWPNRDWSVLRDFPDSRYLEFGWGDARYYQAEEESLWLGIRAAFFSTSSAIHVIGFERPTPEALRADEVIEVRVSAAGLKQLAQSIQLEFSQPQPTATGAVLSVTPSPNKFYDAKRRFFFPRMCNWWTARRLEEASCPITAWSVVSANRIVREAHGFAGAQ